jgi:DNA adenine methylase
MKSPIRYFGGKNGFSRKILEYFPEDYEKMTYIEPFCGSSALLFQKNKSDVEIINDIDHNIYSLFKVITNKTKFEKFKNVLDLTPFSEELLKEYKKDIKKSIEDPVERAYKYFYCNRCSFNSSGSLSISTHVRRNMSKSVSDYLSAIDKLPEVHSRLSNVVILNRDALKVIKKYDKPNVFIYCDSPYANETRSSGRYAFDFADKQQDDYLKVLIENKDAKLLISGYNCKRYSILEKSGFKRIDLEIKTQNNNLEGKSKIESLWMNY